MSDLNERSASPSQDIRSRSAKADKTVARTPLSSDRIVTAAIALMDSAGIAGLTMRKLGASLNVEAMSLYGYFPNKTALLTAARVALFEKIRHVGTDRSDGFDHIRAVMRATYQLVEQHPSFADLIFSGPSEQSTLQQRDSDLAALQSAGLTEQEADYSLQTLISFVMGFVYRGGLPVPDKHDPDTAKPYSSDASFEFGLDLILDGLRRKIIDRAGAA